MDAQYKLSSPLHIIFHHSLVHRFSLSSHIQHYNSSILQFSVSCALSEYWGMWFDFTGNGLTFFRFCVCSGQVAAGTCRSGWRWGLTHSMVGWQGAIQGFSGRQVWTGGFKHWRYVERHPVSSEASLYVAGENVGRVVPVVWDAGQSCVDCQQDQEEL